MTTRPTVARRVSVARHAAPWHLPRHATGWRGRAYRARSSLAFLVISYLVAVIVFQVSALALLKAGW